LWESLSAAAAVAAELIALTGKMQCMCAGNKRTLDFGIHRFRVISFVTGAATQRSISFIPALAI